MSAGNLGGDAYLAFFADPELRDHLDRLARRNERSRSAELRIAVAHHLHRSTAIQSAIRTVASREPAAPKGAVEVTTVELPTS
jgi:hypothetical protein